MNDALMKMIVKNDTILETLQKPHCDLNNRKQDRFAIRPGIYALLSWEASTDRVLLGHLIDINKEGCGIYYISGRSSAAEFCSRNTCKLRIIASHKMIEVNKSTIVYDDELITYSTDQICARRCGLKFELGKISPKH